MLSGCALYTQTEFAEFRGPSEFRGRGGTVKKIEGIEVWTSGEPNVRFKVLGVIDQSHYNNASIMSLIAGLTKNSEIIALAKKQGGDAIIALGSGSAVTGYSSIGYATGHASGVYSKGMYSGSASALSTSYTHADTQTYSRLAVIKYLSDEPAQENSSSASIDYEDGGKYVGETMGGMPHGSGTLTWPSGSKYAGRWQNGVRTGQGAYTWPDGSKYVGEFKNGKREGRGAMTYVDGSVEEGLWRENSFAGKAESRKK